MIPYKYDGYEVVDLKEALSICQKIKADDKHFEIIEREDKNPNDFLRQNNKSVEDVVEPFHSFKEEDYYKGPVPDYDSKRQRMLWIFKKQFCEKECYIKFKIVNKKVKIVVISLHEDEKYG